jgi:hypothetical protein
MRQSGMYAISNAVNVDQLLHKVNFQLFFRIHITSIIRVTIDYCMMQNFRSRRELIKNVIFEFMLLITCNQYICHTQSAVTKEQLFLVHA